KGFQDAAFAAFKRRRSTVREDIGMSFSNNYDEPVAPHGTASAAAETVAPAESNRKSTAPKGQANVSPGKGDISSDDLQEL
ncbi:MAG: cytoplasmic filament protein CfpA, partial [Alkalispirochaeta sp.]